MSRKIIIMVVGGIILLSLIAAFFVQPGKENNEKIQLLKRISLVNTGDCDSDIYYNGNSFLEGRIAVIPFYSLLGVELTFPFANSNSIPVFDGQKINTIEIPVAHTIVFKRIGWNRYSNTSGSITLVPNGDSGFDWITDHCTLTYVPLDQ